MIRHTLLWLCFCSLVPAAGVTATTLDLQAQAELVLVVNPGAGIDALSQEEAVNLFMGRFLQLPSGITARPVDFRPVKSRFYSALIDKNLAEVNAYWARLVFSGQASPPLQIAELQELLEFVANNKGAVSYMPKNKVDGRVKVVGELPDRRQP